MCAGLSNLPDIREYSAANYRNVLHTVEDFKCARNNSYSGNERSPGDVGYGAQCFKVRVAPGGKRRI